MTDRTKDMHLTLFINQMASDLANDLQWALQQLDDLKQHIPKSEALAERYVTAMRHLNTRRVYEAACAKAET